MYVIIEYNGRNSKGVIGLVLDRKGNIRVWNTYLEAAKYGSKNCAFNYKIVEL